MELDSACLFVLLFSFQFSFFLWTTLGLFLLFPSAFIFTSLITHICFSVIENECPSQLRQRHLVEFPPADMGDARDHSVLLIRPPTSPGINGGWTGGDPIGKNRITEYICNSRVNVVH